jgi:hypothetical protein
MIAVSKEYDVSFLWKVVTCVPKMEGKSCNMVQISSNGHIDLIIWLDERTQVLVTFYICTDISLSNVQIRH